MRTLKVSQDNLHNRIVSLVRSSQATSRGALARRLAVAPSTMGLYVDQLIATGWLRESGLVRGGAGRPKMSLEPVAQGTGWFAGVEFTGARIQVIALDFAGRRRSVLTQAMPMPADAETVLRQIKMAVREMAGRMPDRMLGIGVGAPGLVNPAAGIASFCVIFAGWHDVRLAEVLTEAFGVPCLIDNNLRVTALAERLCGAGHGLDDFVVLGPRSGFAMAIVKGGTLLRGAHLAAGEAGFWPLPVGPVETPIHHSLSAPAIWRRLAGVPAGASVPADLHRAFQQMAAAKGAAWDEVTSLFGRVIAMTQCLIDTPLYILHGPLTALGPRFCQELAAQARHLIPALKDLPFDLRPSTLGDDAGALGAASLAMDAWHPGPLF